MRQPARVALAVSAAAFFVALASTRIGGQGPQYDELHQAPSAFLLVGRSPVLFASFTWHGVAVLNMPYSGALKPDLYGLYMRATGRPFTLAGWRWYGIAVAGAGLAGFCFLAARGLGPAATAAFALLVALDSSLLLLARLDYGPVDFALALRLIWIALWVRDETDADSSLLRSFFIGFIPAFSVYEKLSHVVLLGPLLLFACFPGRQRAPGSHRFLGAGAAVGIVPFLAAAGLSRWLPFRFAATSGTGALIPPDAPQLALSFLSLGNGEALRDWILGVAARGAWDWFEAALLAVSLAGALAVAIRGFRTSPLARLAGLGAGSYLLVAALTWVLPPRTAPHHWLTATPFQYLAFAASFAFVWREPAAVPTRLPRLVCSALAALLAFHLYETALTERALARGMAGEGWDPSLGRIAEFVSEHADRATFVAADWGLTTQIFCVSQGTVLLAEPFFHWEFPGTADALRASILSRPGLPVYVLRRGLDERPTLPRATADIERLVNDVTGGARLPLEAELRDLRGVSVVKHGPPSR